MFVEVHTPQRLTDHELDAYLERGWFRMGQTIFTTNFAHVKEKMFSTIWLRVLLNSYQQDTTHLKLIKRNAGFKMNIQPARLSDEKEKLYARYRESLPFSVSESLKHLLLGKSDDPSIYNTFEITLHDEDKLIACGFFDLGEKSAEGVVSFYDPEYKKFSPGRYLIYSKIQFCKEFGLHYFYPGYFVPGNPYFDYKLSIAKRSQEFLQLGSASWCDMADFTDADIPVKQMEIKLILLQEILQASGCECHVLKYEFFDAGLIPEMRGSGLLDFPLFLLIGPLTDEPAGVIIVFDVRDNAYHLQVCTPVWKPDRTNSDKAFYSAFFLKPMQEIYSSAEISHMATLIAQLIQNTILTKIE